MSVPLKVGEFLLATDFALLAKHISNTIQKGSEIPEHAATLCPALDLGARSGCITLSIGIIMASSFWHNTSLARRTSMCPRPAYKHEGRGEGHEDSGEHVIDCMT